MILVQIFKKELLRRFFLKGMASEHLDRISCLPDKAIDEILMCLPIREAVATSRLSTTWRYRWMTISELIFDDLGSTVCKQNIDKWVNFINNLLLLHEGNVIGFEVSDLLDSASPNVDRWLLFLSKKELTFLFVAFRSICSYVCHSSLFSCQALIHLNLHNCGLKVPPKTQFKGFKNLTTLVLKDVTANKETVEFLVNTSPLLKTAYISLTTSNASCLNISAPNLTNCTIGGKFEHIAFTETPKLDFIDFRTWVNEDLVRCKLDRNLDKLLQLQEARICYPFIECLSVDNYLERLPITYYQLRRVRLYICFEDLKQILSAIWLFKSSPSLKTIVIRGADLVNIDLLHEDLCLEELYRTLSKDEDILQSLEVFEFDYFVGLENELKLIEFVLLKASSLQTVTIKWNGEEKRDERDFEALAKLVQFPRTSSGLKFYLI